MRPTATAIQAALSGIDMYPLKDFDGKMKARDWRKSPVFPQPGGSGGGAEARWVFPEKFIEQLPLAVMKAATSDPGLRQAVIDEVTKAEEDLIAPLLQFRNWGIQLPGNWTTRNNGAQFGTDYFARTAVGKSNILVNKPNETKYFYQDLDASGARLNGGARYRVTFSKGGLPPVRGFWSLTLYDRFHFFAPNAIKRYSVGTKNKDLKPNADGSLTIFVQADEPRDPVQRANWLPAPTGDDFSLFVRTYWRRALHPTNERGSGGRI